MTGVLVVGELEPVLHELLEDPERGDAVEGCEHGPARALDPHPGGEPRHLLRDVDHVRVLGEPRFDHALEPGDQSGEPLRAHHERASISSFWSSVPVPFDSVWAIPRITVTGVRSSWPRRLTSS